MDNLTAQWHTWVSYADMGTIVIIMLQLLILAGAMILFFMKWTGLYRSQCRHQRIISGFWGASTLGAALDTLVNFPGARLYNILACRGVQAVNVRNKQAAEGVLVRLSLAQLLARYLRQGMREVRVQLEKGTSIIYWSLFLLPLMGALGFIWQLYVSLSFVSEQVLVFEWLKIALLPLLVGVGGAVLLLLCHAMLRHSIKIVHGNLKAFRSDLQGYLVDVLGNTRVSQQVQKTS